MSSLPNDSETESDSPSERNLGPQPLDAIIEELGLNNHHLVAACSKPMTHKAVQRARKGRRLTSRMQHRVAEALFLAATIAGKAPEKPWKQSDLFTY